MSSARKYRGCHSGGSRNPEAFKKDNATGFRVKHGMTDRDTYLMLCRIFMPLYEPKAHPGFLSAASVPVSYKIHNLDAII